MFITNQNGLATGKTNVKDFRNKVETIVQTLGVPLQLFAATAKHCVFRKPRPGFWEYLERYKNGDITIDQSNSFYCGDAAGRVRAKGKKDFSCSDRLFALNIGTKFYVPEELFLKRKCAEDISMPDFNPKKLMENPPQPLEPANSQLNIPNQEVIVMVGVQVSEKSHFAEKCFGKAGYVIVSNDR